MNPSRRPKVILICGISLAVIGGWVRLIAANYWFNSLIVSISSFGGDGSMLGGDPWEDFKLMSLSVFFLGLVLIVAAVIAWLFQSCTLQGTEPHP